MVRVGDPDHIALLARFDTTHARVGDEVEVLLWPGDRARLDSLGLAYRVTETDVVGRDAPADGDYRHLADYEADVRALAAAHPSRARLLELPHTTREGRRVYGIEIAAGVDQSDDGRPVFYMDGVHHAREWPAGELPMMFAGDLVGSFGADPRVTSLLEAVRVVVVPVVNPDGFHHSRESSVQVPTLGAGNGFEGYWRKNRRSLGDDVARVLPGARAVRPYDPTAYGADPNRNYPYHWGGPGSSSFHVDQTHTGPWPFEPETANVGSIFSSRHVTVAVTNHTYGDLVLRPWGDTWADPPDNAGLKALGDSMAATNGYTSMKGIGLYPTSGTTEDWAYATFGSLAFTFEHGGGFHPPYATTIPAMYENTREAFLIAAEAAARPDLHGILHGTLPEAATVTLRKTVFTPFYFSSGIEEKIETSIEAGPGRFTYHVNPSTRPIADEPEAYEVEIESATGSAHFDVVVARGQTVDLGDVVPA